MAAEAIFILIDGWIQNGGSIGGADTGDVFLGEALEGRWSKCCDHLRSMAAVTINASGMAVIVEQGCFSGIMWIGSVR